MSDHPLVMALHTAISRRSWNEVERAANRIRDEWPTDKHVKASLAWMEERARNSTSFGSHCHAYEVAASHLKLALDGDDIAPVSRS